MQEPQSKTWRDVYRLAIDDTKRAYRGKAPTKEEFLETFTEFYEELIAETTIISYPYDPPNSHRAAKSRATVVWADDFSTKQ